APPLRSAESWSGPRPPPPVPPLAPRAHGRRSAAGLPPGRGERPPQKHRAPGRNRDASYDRPGGNLEREEGSRGGVYLSILLPCPRGSISEPLPRTLRQNRGSTWGGSAIKGDRKGSPRGSFVIHLSPRASVRHR